MSRIEQMHFPQLDSLIFGMLQNEGYCQHAGDGHEADNDEENPVSESILYGAAGHSGEHHPQGHDTGRNGIVGGLVPAVHSIHKVYCESGEAHAVSELFEGHKGIYQSHGGLCIRHIYEEKVREVHD